MRCSTSVLISAENGALVQNFICRALRSVASSAGWSSSRRYCTGTSMAWVARCFSDSFRNCSASNFGISTAVPPLEMVGRYETSVVFE